MPNCKNCGTKWSWGDAFKVSFLNKRICPKCEEMQYLKSHTNAKKFYAAGAFLFIVNIIRPYLDIPLNLFTLIFTLYVCALFIVLPYNTQLSNQPKTR
ncbi:hypothetical protein AUC31_15340 [Planococcus rifietoensis]|uniref:CXXC-20-CXXC protein n=1 Tax=Planococcus rifietoensis TaxID=200991 RepID=A0A0U2Z988_9BACL|nr:hypothetical protein AUC31_15340 [Planococcus rifietoensis]